MKITIKNDITITDYDDTTEKWCRSNLTLDNPDYFKKERLGKWTGGTPRSIFLYKKIANSLVLPFGCLRDVWGRHKNDNVAWDYRIRAIEPLKYTSHINLYPYQEEAVQSVLKARNGVLVMPCGSGKTVCGIESIARIGGRALWVTHTQDLLNQSKKRAMSILDIEKEMLGTITAGKIDIGTHITFATVQTMAKMDLSAYRDVWDIIVVDECQHCAGSPTRVTQFYKVVDSLSARYKIGLTATPRRADGLEQSIFAILGDIIHEVDKSVVETCCVEVEKIYTGWNPPIDEICAGDGTIDYNKVIEALINNRNRTDVVVNTLTSIPCGSPFIVLANRVRYLEELCQRYNDSQTGIAICLSGTGQGKRAREERKQALDALNSGEIDAIFATYQLAKEGLDVPNLRYIVFATPEKDETTVIQSVGRVARKAEGKAIGTVIDFIDAFSMYKGWAKVRDRYYHKIDAKIIP